MSCSLCMKVLPSASKRRRLYGMSSSIVLQSLREEARKHRFNCFIPPLEASGRGPFLCLPCFQQIERLEKAKAAVQQLETEIGSKIAATAKAKNLG